MAIQQQMLLELWGSSMNNKEHYTVQMVKHVNYIAFVEAASQKHAEQLAAEATSEYSWDLMDGPQPTEICCEDGDYLEGESIE